MDALPCELTFDAFDVAHASACRGGIYATTLPDGVMNLAAAR